MTHLDPHMRMHVVRGLQSEMLQRAELDRLTRTGARSHPGRGTTHPVDQADPSPAAAGRSAGGSMIAERGPPVDRNESGGGAPAQTGPQPPPAFGLYGPSIPSFAWKDELQPQLEATFGLSNRKPAPIRPSE